MINADYYGRQGIVVIKKQDQIQISNPGDFRIDIETAKSGDKKATINSKKNTEQKNMIVEFIREYGSAKSSELCDLLGVRSTRVKKLIYELIDEDILVANGGNRNRTYSLKK